MKRTQKQLIEAVQESEKIGEALADLVVAYDNGEGYLRQSVNLNAVVMAEIIFLKEVDLS